MLYCCTCELTRYEHNSKRTRQHFIPKNISTDVKYMKLHIFWKNPTHAPIELRIVLNSGWIIRSGRCTSTAHQLELAVGLTFIIFIEILGLSSAWNLQTCHRLTFSLVSFPCPTLPPPQVSTRQQAAHPALSPSPATIGLAISKDQRNFQKKLLMGYGVFSIDTMQQQLH